MDIENNLGLPIDDYTIEDFLDQYYDIEINEVDDIYYDHEIERRIESTI